MGKSEMRSSKSEAIARPPIERVRDGSEGVAPGGRLPSRRFAPLALSPNPATLGATMAADADNTRTRSPSDAARKRPSLRREGREAALQFLFSHDLNPTLSPDGPEAAAFWNLRSAKPRVRAFATDLLRGLMPHLPEIDARIAAAADNYSFKRLAAVDRNLLRLAVYEMLHRDDIPIPVSINEAIEIAKDFGTEESPRFINGVLDRIRKEGRAGEP